jgi:hypothetical protein
MPAALSERAWETTGTIYHLINQLLLVSWEDGAADKATQANRGEKERRSSMDSQAGLDLRAVVGPLDFVFRPGFRL